MYLRKRETCFIEIDVSGDEHPFGHRIITLVALLIEGIAKERAAHRSRCQFVWGCRSGVRVAEAPEDSEVVVIGRRAKEQLEGDRVVAWPAWPPIEQIGGGRQCIRPEGRRDGGLEQQRANAIIECADNALCTSVLL